MKYKVIEYAIDNQRFFNSLAILLILLGSFIYVTTQKDLFPEIKDAYVNVQIIYPGASAEVIQQQIVNPIESKVISLVEIKHSSSVSRKNVGFTQFTVDRKYFNNLNEVRQLVQNAVNSLDFPKEVLKPKVEIFTLNKEPFMYLHLQGEDKKQLYEISQEVETGLQYISALDKPIIYGREEYQYQINVNPQKLATRGISMNEVFHSIQQAQTDIPSGDIQKDNKTYVLSVVSPVNSVKTLENIVIRANEQGNVVLLKDVAQIEFSFAEATSFHSLNGKEGIVFAIKKAKLGDIIKLKKEVVKFVDAYKVRYPDVKFSTFTDSSLRIASRIKLLNENLSIGLVLVFLVLILFFNYSTALWTTLGVPIAFCIGLIFSVLLGVNINTISMIGFILILGIVVDDGIVFAENSYRHLEMGKSPRQAVIDGMGEVAPSVIFAVITTIAAIGMQLSLGGKIGDFARPLPIIMITTLLGSVFEAVFILPGHLVHAFQHQKMEDSSKSIKNRVFLFFQNKYEGILSVLVRHRKKAFFSMIAFIIIITGFMSLKVPFVFFAGPPKQIYVFFDTKVGSSLEDTRKTTDKISEVLLKNSAFEDVYAVSGIDGESHKSYIQGDIKISADPRYDWLVVKKDIQEHIKNNNLDIYNFRFNIIGEDSFYKDKLELTVKGTNLNAVTEMAKEIQEYLTTISNIDNPRLNISQKTLAQEVIVNPRRAKMFGITPQEIAQNIGIAYEGVTVSTINSNGVQYDIKLQYDTTNHTYTSLTNMRIPNKFARFVNLTELAEIKPTLIETDIYTENGLYAIKIQDSLYETSVLSNNSFGILAEAQEKFQHYTNNLNAAPYFDNEKEEVSQGIRDLSIAILLGVALVFLILLYMFNSFISTFLAISGIPFILFGLTVGLYLMKLPLNNMAIIGMISLLGLVVNDSIVLLEFLYNNLKEDEPFLPALVSGVSTRFRPIFMTTLTTLVGIAPIAFGFAGDEFLLQPLAVVIFFGVLAVSMITLILLPLSISIIEMDLGGLFFKNSKISILEFFNRIIKPFIHSKKQDRKNRRHTLKQSRLNNK